MFKEYLCGKHLFSTTELICEVILNRLKEKLQIDVGNTTADEKFSLETRICLGKCAHAPVIKVNDKIYEKATLELVDKIIEEYKNK